MTDTQTEIPKCPHCWKTPGVDVVPTATGTETFITCNSAGTRADAVRGDGCFNRPMGSGESLGAALRDYLQLTSHARAKEYDRRKAAGLPL